VLHSGTGAGARSQGFWLPAAGKTGTSRDGWFAGFSSELLCVVWVGFDDNRDLKLEGARPALPHLGGLHEAGRADLALPDGTRFPRSARVWSRPGFAATPGNWPGQPVPTHVTRSSSQALNRRP